MKPTRHCVATLFGIALAATLVAAPLQAQLDTEYESGPPEFEESAGWGVDLDTGRIAIDPGLIYYHDPETGTLVVGPAHVQDALAELGAVDRQDGTWLLGDGSSAKPIMGEAAIDFGYGPEEMYQDSGLPRVALDRVELVTTISAQAKRSRWWRTCRNCSTGCGINGVCNGNVLYSTPSNPQSIGSCKFKLFRSCSERYIPVCNYAVYNCLNCTGGVNGSGTVYAWGCSC